MKRSTTTNGCNIGASTYFWPCNVFLCSSIPCGRLNNFPNCPLAGEIRIAFVLYKHIGVYLSTENASMKLGSEAMATNYSVIVNSPVITAAINKDSNKVYLSDPVIFTIRHLQVISCLFMCVWVEMSFVFTLMWLHLMCFLSLSLLLTHKNTLAHAPSR